MRHLFAVVAAVLILPVTAAGAAAPRSPPALKRTLSATGTTSVRCDQGLRSGRGIATTTYRAPLAGFVDVRSAGSKGDWDLALYDARNRQRALQGSNGFGSQEVTQSWATLGRQYVIQACHRSGAGTTLPVAITFTDVTLL